LRLGCLRLRATARQDGEHGAAFHGRRTLDDSDVSHAGSDATYLVARDLWVCRFTSPEAHFDLNFVAFLEEAPRGANPDLQVMIVRAWADAYLFDLGNVLVLLGVSGSLVLFEFELPEIGDATHWRLGGRGDLDQVKAGFFGTANGLLGRHDADLLPLGVEDPHLRDSYLAIGPRTSGSRWSRYEWWTRNRRSPSSV
jgi:hypothetical protein